MSKINALKNDLAAAIASLAPLAHAHAEAHPNACPTCEGKGGVVKTYPATFWEPSESEWQGCPSCFERGLNPLDLNSEMSEEEADLWVENAYEGKYPSESLMALEDIKGQIDHLTDHLSDLMYEEENPDR